MEEARAYMADEVLGMHMIEICQALLNLDTSDASKVLGFPDDLKLLSSMTLFEKAVPEQKVFGAVIEKFYGGRRDEKTLEILSTKIGTGL